MFRERSQATILQSQMVAFDLEPVLFRRFPDHFEVILALFQNLTIFSVFWLYSKTLPFLAYFGRFLDHFEPILARYENLTTLEKWLIENGLF